MAISLQTKGNEAANTGGAQSVLNAAAAANVNEVLDSILPPTVASYVELVKVHLNAGRLSFSHTHLYIHFDEPLFVGRHIVPQLSSL